MRKNNIALLLGLGILVFWTAHCIAESDVDKIAALLTAPLTPSAEVTEIFERAERLLALYDDDPTYRRSRDRERAWSRLAQAKARYGVPQGGVAIFDKQFKELEARTLTPQEKDEAFGVILLVMGEVGLAPDAARKAEAHPSPTVRAIAPYLLGELQFLNEQNEEVRKSFERALTLLAIAPESDLKTNLIYRIITYAGTDESMYDVILLAEDCGPIPEQYRFIFSHAWCKVHQDDLATGKFEPFLKRAEAETDDHAQADFVRAVIKEQMKQGKFADVQKTIDRIFLPGADKKEVAADAAAIVGRFDGHDLCLETWAIGLTQHGKLAEAVTVIDSIEERSRRNATINKVIGILIGKDVEAKVLYGLLSDTMLGGDAPDEDIPAPKYTDTELLEFCRWYEALAEQMPRGGAKIKQTAAAAGLMSRLGFKKEAEELYDKAFADVLAFEGRDQFDTESVRIHAVDAIVEFRIAADDIDAALEFIEKLPEHGFRVADYRKIWWFCAMGKFDDAIALVESDVQEDAFSIRTRGFHWETIIVSLFVADRSEEAEKILEKVVASGYAVAPDEIRKTVLLQGGRIGEAFALFPYGSEGLLKTAWDQRMDGNMADAEKTLLEAVKQAEQLPYKGLQPILVQLAFDPKMGRRLLSQLE